MDFEYAPVADQQRPAAREHFRIERRLEGDLGADSRRIAERDRYTRQAHLSAERREPACGHYNRA